MEFKGRCKIVVGEQGSAISTGSDANDFTEEGKFLRGNGVTVANLPTNGAGLLHVIRYTGFRKQIWDDTSSNRQFVRVSWGSVANWHSWYEVTLTVVS